MSMLTDSMVFFWKASPNLIIHTFSRPFTPNLQHIMKEGFQKTGSHFEILQPHMRHIFMVCLCRWSFYIVCFILSIVSFVLSVFSLALVFYCPVYVFFFIVKCQLFIVSGKFFLSYFNAIFLLSKDIFQLSFVIFFYKVYHQFLN